MPKGTAVSKLQYRVATRHDLTAGVLMRKLPLLIPIALTLTGCGLADTSTAAVSAAASKAQEIRAGQQAEARIKSQIDAAYQQAAEQRHAADAASQ